MIVELRVYFKYSLLFFLISKKKKKIMWFNMFLFELKNNWKYFLNDFFCFYVVCLNDEIV